jgi:hypothetical protein
MPVYGKPLIGRNLTVFLSKQTDADTPAYPAAGDAMRVTELSGFQFRAQMIESPERIPNSLDVPKLIGAGLAHAEGTIAALIKPGAAGVVHGDKLLEALFGRRNYDAATKRVTYTQYAPSDPETYWTIAFMLDRVAFWLIGCRCTGGQFRFSGESRADDIFQVSTDWIALRRAYAGVSQLTAAAATGATTLSVANAKLFEKDAQILVGSQATVYTVTGVDYAANTLTISPGLSASASSGDTVKPYLPTPSVPSGTEIWTGLGWARQGSTAIPIVSASVRYEVPLEVVREKANTVFPTRVFESDPRNVTAEVVLFMGADELQYLRDAIDTTIWELDFEAGDGAGPGPWAKLSIPRAATSDVSFDIDPAAVRMTRRFRGLANAGNDVISLTVQTT